MTNILFLSNNTVFKEDLADQIKHHAPEFVFVESTDQNPDVVVVDEDKAALETLIQKDLKAPILFLSAAEDVKIQTQVIEKPFYLSSFLDKLRASINVYENSEDGSLAFNQYVLYLSRKEILNLRNNKTTKLTEKEVSILKYLYKNSEKIVSKNDLMQEVWQYAADATTHTVETHIYRLRQKVEQDDPVAQIILTSEGGYQLKL